MPLASYQFSPILAEGQPEPRPQDIVAQRSAEFEARRDAVVALLEASPGLTHTRPHGAFYVYVSCADWIGRCTPAGQRLSTMMSPTILLAGSAVAGWCTNRQPSARVAPC